MMMWARRLRRTWWKKWDLFMLTVNTLLYNSFTSWSTLLDIVLEPMYWFVDHSIKYLGPVFVLLVAVLTSSVVLIFYVCLLPHEHMNGGIGWSGFHLIFGHWLLVNIVFHYIKAAFTPPGTPPEGLVLLVILVTTSGVVIAYTCLLPHKLEQSVPWTCVHLVLGHWLLINVVFHYVKAAFTDPGRVAQEIPEVVSICKKCIAPKPPRAHHCSVCKRCVLKMDHHCPWLNNCVGHKNHRHFFLFCVYMWIGTVYVTFVGYDLFKEHFFEVKTETVYQIKDTQDGGGTKNGVTGSAVDPVVSIHPNDTRGQYFHHLVIYEFMLCSGVAVALGLLTLWHARLISRGETSIEVHINRKEAKRIKKLGQVYRNPYNFGLVTNWKMLLGLGKGRSFWRHVLLPSNHPPVEDGLRWQTTTYTVDTGLMLL